MIKIVCDNLEEAYEQACSKLECSVAQVHLDIVQYPRNIFGIIKRKAIVIACKQDVSSEDVLKYKDAHEQEDVQDTVIDIKEPKPDKHTSKDDGQDRAQINFKNKVVDSFYQDAIPSSSKNKPMQDKDELVSEISSIIKDVFCLECLDCQLDKIEFFDEKTIYIKFSGKDSSLMIGKNGHRYKALSYLIFSWIFPKYNLFVKIEIGNFLFNQNEMIKKHLESFVQEIKMNGYGNTDSLDGVLLHLGVEHLRDKFPNKMVVVKVNRDSTRYIKVSDFRR